MNGWACNEQWPKPPVIVDWISSYLVNNAYCVQIDNERWWVFHRLPDGVHSSQNFKVGADILAGSSPWDYQGKSRSGGLGRGYLVVGCCGKGLGSCHDLIKLTTDAFASLVWFSWIFGAKNIRVWLSFGSLLFFTDFSLCSYSWFLCRAILSSPRTSSIRLSALEATRIGKPMVLLWARTAVVLATVLQDSSARAHKWNTALDRDQRYIYIDWLRQQSNLTLAFVILSWSMLRMWCMTPPGKGK